MRTLEELQERLKDYPQAEYLYVPDFGYLAWGVGTGLNLEALFTEVIEKGKGHGKELYRRMIRRLEEQGWRPYHSVYGFRRTENVAAQRFYASMGWHQLDLGQAIYRDGGTTVMWLEYDTLKRNLGL